MPAFKSYPFVMGIFVLCNQYLKRFTFIWIGECGETHTSFQCRAPVVFIGLSKRNTAGIRGESSPHPQPTQCHPAPNQRNYRWLFPIINHEFVRKSRLRAV